MPKPTFNPNLPMDPKPPFDPNSPVESPQLGSSLKDSKLGQLLGAVLSPVQAGREGFIKGATFGGVQSTFPGAEQQSDKSMLNKTAALAGETGASLGLGELGGMGVSKAVSGIRGLGGALMDAALGTKAKDLPGIGKTAFEEGLVGTKGMMAKQAQQKAAQRTAELESKIGELSATAPEQTAELLSHEPAAKAVEEMRNSFYTKGGQPMSGAAEADPIISKYAAKIRERVPSSPQEILEFKRATNPLGYSAKRGEPLDALKAKLARKESEAYGQQLAEAWKAKHPESSETISELNYKISRLLKANQVAGRGGSPDLSSLLLKGAKKLPGAALGGAVGGPTGAAIGAALPEELLFSGAARYGARPAAAALEAVQPATTLAPLGAQVKRLQNSQEKPPFDPNQPIE